MYRHTSTPSRLTLLATSLVAAGLAGLSGTASAQTETANLDVSATVAASCTISTAALAFGTYDPIVTNASDPLDATGTVTVTCTNGSTTAITLGQGANADGTSTDAAPERRMAAGTDHLSYDLYSDTGRTTVWGNTAPTSVAHTGTGTSTDLTVYGRITGGQNVPAASYADTVVATVTF